MTASLYPGVLDRPPLYMPGEYRDSDPPPADDDESDADGYYLPEPEPPRHDYPPREPDPDIDY